jgi:hypothetical protein
VETEVLHNLNAMQLLLAIVSRYHWTRGEGLELIMLESINFLAGSINSSPRSKPDSLFGLYMHAQLHFFFAFLFNYHIDLEIQ